MHLYPWQQRILDEVTERYSEGTIALKGMPFYVIGAKAALAVEYPPADRLKGATGFDGESSGGLGVGTQQS